MTQKLTTYFFSLIFLLLSPLSHASADNSDVDSPVEEANVRALGYSALVAVYDFSYKNVIPRQKMAAKLFTGEGWGNFLDAIIKSKLLDIVNKNQYNVTTTPLRPPAIVKQGLFKGVYYWQIEFPAMILFKNSEHQQVQYLNIKQQIIYQDGTIMVDKFLAKKGTPINCQATEKGVTVGETAPAEKK